VHHPQLPCSLDFACNSLKLKDLAHSGNLTLLFSRFCGERGEGGYPVLNSKLCSNVENRRRWLWVRGAIQSLSNAAAGGGRS
jgi:hypothetical protein